MDSQSSEIKMTVGTITGIELNASRVPPGLWKAVVAEQHRLARLLDMNASPYKLVYRAVPGKWNFPSHEQALGRLNRGMSPFTPWHDTDPFPFLFDEHLKGLCTTLGIDHKLLDKTSHNAFSMSCDASVVRETEERNRLYSIARRPGKATAIQHRSDVRTITASLLYSGLDPDKVLVINPRIEPQSDWAKELEDFPRVWEGTCTLQSSEEELKNFMDSLTPKTERALPIPYMMFGETWEEFHERMGCPLTEAQKEAYRNRPELIPKPIVIPHYEAKPEVNLSPRSKRKTLLRKSRKQNRTARKKQRG